MQIFEKKLYFSKFKASVTPVRRHNMYFSRPFPILKVEAQKLVCSGILT